MAKNSSLIVYVYSDDELDDLLVASLEPILEARYDVPSVTIYQRASPEVTMDMKALFALPGMAEISSATLAAQKKFFAENDGEVEFARLVGDVVGHYDPNKPGRLTINSKLLDLVLDAKDKPQPSVETLALVEVFGPRS